MADPFLEVLQDEDWLDRVAEHEGPAAKAFMRHLTHDILPKVVRGLEYRDDGTFTNLITDLFIECPDLRPQEAELD